MGNGKKPQLGIGKVTYADMKNLRRISFAVLSTLLLAAGFARAADKFDPVLLSSKSAVENAPIELTDGCWYCDAPVT